jgi:hypothetical protein
MNHWLWDFIANSIGSGSTTNLVLRCSGTNSSNERSLGSIGISSFFRAFLGAGDDDGGMVVLSAGPHGIYSRLITVPSEVHQVADPKSALLEDSRCKTPRRSRNLAHDLRRNFQHAFKLLGGG